LESAGFAGRVLFWVEERRLRRAPLVLGSDTGSDAFFAKEQDTMQDYHQLDVWHRAMDLAVGVYRFTLRLPPDERFVMVVQLRKAVTSIPLNIAEGCGCTTNPEFARFLGYAYRSAKEVVTGLELCVRLYPDLAKEAAPPLVEAGNRIARMRQGLMQRLG
jgi:four helix bundle protein